MVFGRARHPSVDVQGCTPGQRCSNALGIWRRQHLTQNLATKFEPPIGPRNVEQEFKSRVPINESYSPFVLFSTNYQSFVSIGGFWAIHLEACRRCSTPAAQKPKSFNVDQHVSSCFTGGSSLSFPWTNTGHKDFAFGGPWNFTIQFGPGSLIKPLHGRWHTRCLHIPKLSSNDLWLHGRISYNEVPQ